jgi:hypothetical protein
MSDAVKKNQYGQYKIRMDVPLRQKNDQWQLSGLGT